MPRLRYTKRAQDDFESIALYIRAMSGERRPASRFTAALDRRCRELAAAPFTMGRSRPELGPGVRSAVHSGYVILFRYVEDRFDVLAIIEGHRDIDAIFSA